MIPSRLIEVAKYVNGYNYLLDVGSDHAYLPIYALEKGYVKKATASDIGDGPLLNAKKNISLANLDIDTIKYDGIPATDADVISICGMGGELIINILDNSLNNAKKAKRLILAPNCDTVMLRKNIISKGYYFVDEEIVKEKNHFYEILVLEIGQGIYNEDELYFGPCLLKKKSSIFLEKYNKRLKKLESITNGITDIVKKREIDEEIERIRRLFE